MGEHSICPHCGYDLRNDEPITIGDAHFDPTLGLFYRGQPVHLTPNERIFIASLMKANGRFVSNPAMVERLGAEEVVNPEDYVRIYACRVRKIFARLGAGRVIVNSYGQGYRWAVPQMAKAA